MLKYATQIKDGDRFYLKLNDFQSQGGRVKNENGWVRVVVSHRKPPVMDDEDIEVVLITQHDQRLNTTLPTTLVIDIESEGSPESMSKLGDVHYENLSGVVKYGGIV